MSDNNATHALKFARLGAAYAIELGKGELGGPPAESGSSWQWLAALGGLALAAGAFVRRRS